MSDGKEFQRSQEESLGNAALEMRILGNLHFMTWLNRQEPERKYLNQFKSLSVILTEAKLSRRC